MALQSAVDGVLKVFTDLMQSKKKYEQTVEAMNEDDQKKEMDKRLDEYKAMCIGGATSMLWKDTYSLTKKLHDISPLMGAIIAMFFICALFGILLGFVASSFSRSAPGAMAISSNGALSTILFFIVICHLEMLDFIQIVVLMGSCALLCSTFIGYWYFCARDLKVLLVAGKLCLMIIGVIWSWLMTICRYVVAKVMYLTGTSGVFWRSNSDGIPLRDMDPLLSENEYSDEMVWRQHNENFIL